MHGVEKGNPQDVEEGTSVPKGQIEEISETLVTTDSTLFANKQPKRVQFRDVLREEDSDPLRPKGKQVESLRPRLTSNCILILEEEPAISDALESRDFRALRLTHRNANTGAANGISSRLRDNEFIALIVHAPRKRWIFMKIGIMHTFGLLLHGRAWQMKIRSLYSGLAP